ncbi:MAG: DinB family protein [Candidatus Thorarchaeota archaeon]
MSSVDFIKSIAKFTRVLRERALQRLQDNGCTDLSYRPATGMSSIGWLLVHQAVVYDFVLNILIKGTDLKYPELFDMYGGSHNDQGDWLGTSLALEAYYDSAEGDFLFWADNTSEEEMYRRLDESCPSGYHRNMRVIDVISDMFAHLNHHNGHLGAINGDWCIQKGKST